MKLIHKHPGKLVAIVVGVLALLTVFAARLVWAVPPGLSIMLTPTNTVQLTVTNGSPTGMYDIYWQEFLDTTATWEWVATGTTGQTNFLVDISETETGFFVAASGNDFDGDGVPNTSDARPFDPAIGILRVTIESPANGSNVQ